MTPQEVAEVMLAIVERDKTSTNVMGSSKEDITIHGGSCLEVSAGQVRDVPEHNNLGPSGRVGNQISNGDELYKETLELIKPGSAKT